MNLPPWPAVPQYSTPNGTPPAARETAPSVPRRKQKSPATPSGLHAGERAVKPHGTSTNRTSSAVNAARPGTTRSSRDGNRGFFQNLPPSDGPRRPGAAAGPPPPADAHALGNGTIVGGDVPSPARSPDTAARQVAGTKAVPLPRKIGYSTSPEDDAERTTSRTPSTDRSAHDNSQVLAAAAKTDHAGPRTKGAPTPEGQAPAAELPLRSGTLLNRYVLLLTLPPSTLITRLPLFHPSLRFPAHPAPVRRESTARGLAPWPRETGPQLRRD